MKKAEIVKSVNGLFSKTSFQLKKHSPEILVVAGVIGVVTSAVMACKATTKVTGRLIRLRNRILVNMDFKRQTVSHHEDVFVRYSIEQYKDVGRTRWDPYKNEPITNAAGLCYVWRKIVNTDESRQLALLEIVEKHPRAIIFYNFDYELELLKELFIPYADTIYFEIAEWNGHKHQPIPESKSWVYLVQYNAGAEGWNCIKTDTIPFVPVNLNRQEQMWYMALFMN